MNLAVADSRINLLMLGLCRYQEAWDIQRKLHKDLINGSGSEALIICEHPAVITLGTSAKDENILIGHADLHRKGIEVCKTERGGDVTFHGPGQLVVYPILDLRNRKRDVGWYMRSLEEVIIRSLQHFGIHAFRVPGKTGVWTQVSENDKDFCGKKIASLGVRISRWCTLHGFALNVQDCEWGFSYIHPCGFRGIDITSMKQETGLSFSMREIESEVMRNFNELFPLLAATG